LVFELLFWPIEKTLEALQRYAVVERVENLIYWNKDHTAGLLPVASYRSGVGITAGANLFHNNLLGYDETLRLAARYGGRFVQAYELLFEAERLAGSRIWAEARARYEVNPGQLFAGFGASENQTRPPGVADPRLLATKSYYRQERALGLLTVGYTMGNVGSLIKTGVSVAFNHREFGPDETGRLSVEEVYDTDLIPGFEDGVTVLELSGNLVVDMRAGPGLDSRGVYFELFGGSSVPVEGFDYVHYGGELSYTLDLYRRTRLLTLRAMVEAVHAEAEDIPFTDLPRLGGADRLRGYREDQFADEKAALSSIEYHYPIHKNIHGELFLDAGYVAPTYRALFEDLGRFRIGGGGGFLFGSENDLALRVELSYGDAFQFFVSSDLAAAFDGRSTEL
jgi:outer membrane protein assembly factor BamA